MYCQDKGSTASKSKEGKSDAHPFPLASAHGDVTASRRFLSAFSRFYVRV